MNRIIMVMILAVILSDAGEISLVGGGNLQSVEFNNYAEDADWVEECLDTVLLDEHYYVKGNDLHLGITYEFSRPIIRDFNLGLETGLFMQSLNDTVAKMSVDSLQTSHPKSALLLPVLVKGGIDLKEKVGLGVATGPVTVSYLASDFFSAASTKKILANFLGWQAQTDARLKVFPRIDLVLKIGFNYFPRFTKDHKKEVVVQNESGTVIGTYFEKYDQNSFNWLFSLGLGFRL